VTWNAAWRRAYSIYVTHLSQGQADRSHSDAAPVDKHGLVLFGFIVAACQLRPVHAFGIFFAQSVRYQADSKAVYKPLYTADSLYSLHPRSADEVVNIDQQKFISRL